MTPPAPPKSSPEIEQRVSAPDFWKDQAAAQKLLQRRRRLEDDRDLSESLKRRATISPCSSNGRRRASRSLDDLAAASTISAREVDAGETKKMLGGEHDRKNAIITIHPGAGGTESQDWAEMLLRMYLRWTERRGFKREVMDVQPGDEAGIKSATLTIYGDYAYGHAAGRGRRASARAHLAVRPGGAPPHLVRVALRLAGAARGRRRRDRREGSPHRHLPLERRRRPARQRHRLRHPHHPPADRHRRLLPERALAAQEPRAGDEGAEVAAVRPEDEGAAGQARAARRREADIAFGSQIRSYVLQPYQMVKDHRTKEQVGDVNRVLDGDIDVFIKAYLMKKAAGALAQRRLRIED